MTLSRELDAKLAEAIGCKVAWVEHWCDVPHVLIEMLPTCTCDNRLHSDIHDYPHAGQDVLRLYSTAPTPETTFQLIEGLAKQGIVVISGNSDGWMVTADDKYGAHNGGRNTDLKIAVVEAAVLALGLDS